MARMFDGKRALKGNDNSGAMSEQEDMDSEIMTGERDEHSLISLTESLEELYNSSNSGRKQETALGERDNGDDESYVESDSDSDSDSDSEESYDSNGSMDDDAEELEGIKQKEDDASECSPTSVSDPLGDSSGKDSNQKEKKAVKRSSFLGRLFGGIKKRDNRDETNKSSYSIKSSNTESKFNNSHNLDVPEGEIEPSESVHVFDDNSESHRVEDDGDIEIPLVDDDSTPTINEGGSSRLKKRIKYKGGMPDVTEEDEGNETNEEGQEDQSDSLPIQENLENLSPNSGHVKKCVENINSLIKEIKEKKHDVPVNAGKKDDAPHRIPPDNDGYAPDSPRVKTKKTKSKSKKKGSKEKLNAHPSALAARSHGATTTSRIDHSGQISSALGPVQVAPAEVIPVFQHRDKLQNEVYRLRSLVEIMMTRMELYERQSEFLIEATEDHTREWKVAVVEKKRAKKSRVDEKLSDIKDLLMERSAQDKWIRKLEGVQREYQERLMTTQNQLGKLRSEHLITNQKVKDMRKHKASSADSGNTELTPETVESTKNPSEMTTPVAKNRNVALSRWTGDAGARAGEPNAPSIVQIIPNGKKPEDAIDNTERTTALDPEGRKIATLLEEMIVSWHTTASDMSPLSDKREKKKKKKDKKKKKKKERYTGEIL